jgi:hypothetical protein
MSSDKLQNIATVATTPTPKAQWRTINYCVFSDLDVDPFGEAHQNAGNTPQ